MPPASDRALIAVPPRAFTAVTRAPSMTTWFCQTTLSWSFQLIISVALASQNFTVDLSNVELRLQTVPSVMSRDLWAFSIVQSTSDSQERSVTLAPETRLVISVLDIVMLLWPSAETPYLQSMNLQSTTEACE